MFRLLVRCQRGSVGKDTAAAASATRRCHHRRRFLSSSSSSSCCHQYYDRHQRDIRDGRTAAVVSSSSTVRRGICHHQHQHHNIHVAHDSNYDQQRQHRIIRFQSSSSSSRTPTTASSTSLSSPQQHQSRPPPPPQKPQQQKQQRQHQQPQQQQRQPNKANQQTSPPAVPHHRQQKRTHRGQDADDGKVLFRQWVDQIHTLQTRIKELQQQQPQQTGGGGVTTWRPPTKTKVLAPSIFWPKYCSVLRDVVGDDGTDSHQPQPQQQQRDEIKHEIDVLLGEIRDCVVGGQQQQGAGKKKAGGGVVSPTNQHRHEMTKLFEFVLRLLRDLSSFGYYSQHDDHGMKMYDTDVVSGGEEERRHTASSRTSTTTRDRDLLYKTSCQTILDLMKQWKLELQQPHIDSLLHVAAMERQWDAAADLLLTYLDPSLSGGRHIDARAILTNPIGLYVIAKHVQQQQQENQRAEKDVGANVVIIDQVLDVVQTMCMFSSPTDQEKFVLAAGIAIGYAGEAQAFVDYLATSLNVTTSSSSSSSSNNTDQYGQDLIAAVMKSCLICDLPDKAIDVYKEYAITSDGADSNIAGSSTNNQGNASMAPSQEWQWGGGEDYRHIDHPLCRDFAMSALGGGGGATGVHPTRSRHSDGVANMAGNSGLALKLFHRATEQPKQPRHRHDIPDTDSRGLAENKNKISVDALVGVLRACEVDHRWEDAVGALLSVFSFRPPERTTEQNQHQSPDESLLFLNDDIMLSYVDRNQDHESGQSHDLMMMDVLRKALCPVMRTCNSAKQFGVALLCLRLVQLSSAAAAAFAPPSQPTTTGTVVTAASLPPLVGSLLPMITNGVSDDEDVEIQDELLSTVMVSLCGLDCYRDAAQLFESAVGITGREESTSSFWPSASDVNEVVQSELQQRRDLHVSIHNSWDTAHRNLHRLTAALYSIGNTGHPRTDDVSQIPANDGDSSKILSAALATTIRSCTEAGQAEAGLIVAKWMEPYLLDLEQNTTSTSRSALGRGLFPLPDSLLSAMMGASNSTGKIGLALQLYDKHVGSERMQAYVLSCMEGVRALHREGRHDEAFNLFQNTVLNTRTPELFQVMAHGLADNHDWPRIPDVYRLAMTSGCISDELSILTMKSVVRSKMDNSIRILRNIASESAKAAGTVDPDTWVESKYWHLKRGIGFNNARLLMWWNDKDTCHLDELDLALKVFEERQSAGLTPKGDVIRLIVAAAAAYDKVLVVVNDAAVATELDKWPRIPRDQDGWTDVMAKALEELKDVRAHPPLVDDVADACYNLGFHEEGVAFVRDSLAQGMPLRHRALAAMAKSCEECSIELPDDVRIFVDDRIAH